ncbi:MAG TPA: tripartite tricarboxylate transporter TctB family protein [Kiloniellaceae bacterium]
MELAVQLAAPVGFLAAALILPAFIVDSERPFRGVGLGPTAWPAAMLAFIAVCAAIWLAQELLAWRRGRIVPLATEATPPGEVYSIPKAVIGLVMIVAYGGLLPIIGFPIATAIFIALWCIFGGVRNPAAVAPLSLLGTAALLWLFMGLALMPLNRGQGIFDEISIAILRMLGIY